MHGVQERTLGRVEAWMMQFDVFLKAPSSIVGPGAEIVLPPDVVAAGHEVHHESELVVVIGRGGKDIPVESAMDAVLGFTARAGHHRPQRRRPVPPQELRHVQPARARGWSPPTRSATARGWTSCSTSGGEVRQSVNTRDMLTPVPQIVSYASRMMTLNPGDVLFTGAPPGVGPITSGEKLEMTIGGIGTMTVTVR